MAIPDVTDDLLYGIAVRYFERDPPAKAEELRDWLHSQGVVTATRQNVFPLLHEASRRGFVRVLPESDIELRKRLQTRYPAMPGDVSIVNVEEDLVPGALAKKTAERIVKLIHRVYEDKVKAGEKDPRVHIGLGAGDTGRRVAQRLAIALGKGVDVPPLTFHALSAGFDPHNPMTAPVAFFSYFHRLRSPVEFVSLISQPWVEWSKYARVKSQLVVSISFREAKKIDIVVTSLAQADDVHGLLNEFLRLYKGETFPLRAAGHVGDIQWQPYSEDKPLSVDTGIRAVTLFDLQGLVRLASREDKHVVLVAGPCHGCGKRKAAALRPLLSRPRLRAFNHLVTDTQTVLQLI